MTQSLPALTKLSIWAPGTPVPIEEVLALLGFVGQTLVPSLSEQNSHRPELRTVLDDLSEATRVAQEHLRPGRASITALMEALRSGDAPTRLSAAQSLSERGGESDEAAGILFQTALHDTDAVVRLQAAVALFRIDGRVNVVLPLLVRALSDTSDAVCWYAADCLRQIGQAAKDAAPAVRESLQRQDRVALVRRSLELALAAIARD